MTIKVAVASQGGLKFVVYHYSGYIDPSEVFASVKRAASQLVPNEAYRVLLLFNYDTDLSDCDREFLATLYRQCDDLFRELKLGKRTAAAMVDKSIDAKLIVPLFNALARMGGGADLSFDLFTTIEPALKHLGVPREDGMRIIARAT